MDQCLVQSSSNGHADIGGPTAMWQTCPRLLMFLQMFQIALLDVVTVPSTGIQRFWRGGREVDGSGSTHCSHGQPADAAVHL